MITINARFTFVIPDELLERIKALATQMGYNTSELINNVLRDYAGGVRYDKLEQRVSELEAEVQRLKEK